MKRLMTVILSLILIIPLVIGLGSWIIERHHYEVTDNAYLKTNLLILSPKVQAYVKQLNIRDNQAVKKGQLLLTLEDRDFRAKVTQAQAAIDAEKAYSQRLQAMKAAQQARINTARANIVVAQAKLEPFAKDVQRFTDLIQRGSAPVQMLDNLKSQSKQAQAELSGEQSTLTAQQQQLLTLDSEMAEVQARLKNAQAQLELAQLDWEYTRIYAPSSGVIGNRGVQLGQLVRPGMALAYLVETQTIWVEANFKENQLTAMRVGQPVSISVDAYPDLEFHGTVDSFAPASGSEFSLLPPENATGNFTKIVRRVPVKIVFARGSDTHLLKAGFSAEVKIRVRE
jgi:membrane fusion protein (multidrug efflux system)